MDFNKNITYPSQYNNIINNLIYNNITCHFKRGDLIINKNIYRYRNYNIGIIDIIDDIIIICSLDYDNCEEGYPNVPIQFLDLLINNPLYYYNNIALKDYELQQSIIDFDKLTIDNILIFNSQFFIINNTKCLIGFHNFIKSLEEIIELLKKNLDYKSKTILSTKKYDEYIIIYC